MTGHFYGDIFTGEQWLVSGDEMAVGDLKQCMGDLKQCMGNLKQCMGDLKYLHQNEGENEEGGGGEGKWLDFVKTQNQCEFKRIYSSLLERQ